MYVRTPRLISSPSEDGGWQQSGLRNDEKKKTAQNEENARGSERERGKTRFTVTRRSLPIESPRTVLRATGGPGRCTSDRGCTHSERTQATRLDRTRGGVCTENKMEYNLPSHLSTPPISGCARWSVGKALQKRWLGFQEPPKPALHLPKLELGCRMLLQREKAKKKKKNMELEPRCSELCHLAFSLFCSQGFMKKRVKNGKERA